MLWGIRTRRCPDVVTAAIRSRSSGSGSCGVPCDHGPPVGRLCVVVRVAGARRPSVIMGCPCKALRVVIPRCRHATSLRDHGLSVGGVCAWSRLAGTRRLSVIMGCPRAASQRDLGRRWVPSCPILGWPARLRDLGQWESRRDPGCPWAASAGDPLAGGRPLFVIPGGSRDSVIFARGGLLIDPGLPMGGVSACGLPAAGPLRGPGRARAVPL